MDSQQAKFPVQRIQEVTRAKKDPQNVELAIQAAYACDRAGLEEDAIVFYDRAWQLGVPAEQKRHFLVGYGSTLRNVGRVDESIRVLSSALGEDAQYAPLNAFLAISLHDAGRFRESMAAALTALADASGGDGIDGFERAIRHYATEFRDAN